MFLEIPQNWQENTCAWVSFLVKVQARGLQIYYKRDSGTGVFCEFCGISKNTFFTEHLRMTASAVRNPSGGCWIEKVSFLYKQCKTSKILKNI